MNQKGFVNIIVIGIVVTILLGIAGYFIIGNKTDGRKVLRDKISIECSKGGKVITQECGKLLEECRRKYLGEPECSVGVNKVEPTSALVPVTECKADSDCPSARYTCEATQGVGTACPSTDPSCVPASRITKGVCKLKEGSQCRTDAGCAGGLACHTGVCTSPIGRQCSGANDTSCPIGYECMQGCGPPVIYPDAPPASYQCQLKGYKKPYGCPICLAANTLIDTPSGPVPVKDLQVGMPVWTADTSGHRVAGIVTKTSKVPVPPTHQMVHVVLDDGREMFASPGHPTIDGRTIGDIAVNDRYGGARVVLSERVAYGDAATYDILPSGETGFYWANGILVGSTLH